MVNESILSLFPPRSDGRRSYSSNSYNPPPPLFNRDDWSSVKREQGSNLISFIQFVEMFFSLDWSDEIWKCWTQISLQDHREPAVPAAWVRWQAHHLAGWHPYLFCSKWVVSPVVSKDSWQRQQVQTRNNRFIIQVCSLWYPHKSLKYCILYIHSNRVLPQL